MRVEVTGVLEDGAPRAAGVPFNARRNLNVPHGVDLTLIVSVVTPLGNGVSLEGDGTELLLTVKRRSFQSPPNIVKAASLNGNKGTFLIQPGDTRRMQPGLFGWDVWLTRDGIRDPVIPLSPFSLQAANAAVPAQPPPEIVPITQGDTTPFRIDLSPINITGWTVELLVVTEPTTTVIVATIPNGLDGLALADVSTLPVGKFASHIKTTDLVPETLTSQPAFIMNVLAAP